MLKRETILAIFISTIALLVAIAKPDTTPTDDVSRTITVQVRGEYSQVADSVYFGVELRRQDVLPENLTSVLGEWNEYIEILEDDRVDVFYQRMSMYNYANVDGLQDPLNPYVTMRVALYDLSRFTQVLEHVTLVEATSIPWVTFFVNDDDMMRYEAEKDALEQASITAERLAHLEGYSLGRITSIDFSLPSYDTSQPYSDTEGLEEVEGLVINPPPINITINATATFELR